MDKNCQVTRNKRREDKEDARRDKAWGTVEADVNNVQATKALRSLALCITQLALRAPYMDSLAPSPGVGCILQHHRPLSFTVGGDIPCCHLPWGYLTGPLNEEG